MPHPSTSSAYGIWSLNEIRDAVRGDNWPTEINWTVILSNVTYDSVSLSVSAQDSFPSEVEFNNDGTKMYVVGRGGGTILQYSLSTSFDLSTASYDSVSLSISSQDGFPNGLSFNNDGTKLYLAGSANDSIYQYSLSTAFDLSTASYDSISLNVNSQDGAPVDVAFNLDGTKMYMMGAINDAVYQYTLSTAFDLSTASYDSVSFSITSQDTNPQSLAFNSNGTKMYFVGVAGDAVYQYSLSTAFDLSTASYDSVSFSVSSQETDPTGVTFSSDGSKMYICGSSTDTVYQYSTGL